MRACLTKRLIFIRVACFIIILVSIAYAMQFLALAVGVIPARVLVENCVVTGGGLQSGTTSTVSFLLENSSSENAVYSVLITAQWQNIDSPPAEFATTNQVFIEGIGANEIVSADFDVSVKAVDIMSSHSLRCNLTISYYTLSYREYIVSDDTMQTGWKDSYEIFTNVVSVQVPVMSEPSASSTPEIEKSTDSAADEPGAATPNLRQIGYAAAFGLCLCILAATALLRKKSGRGT